MSRLLITIFAAINLTACGHGDHDSTVKTLPTATVVAVTIAAQEPAAVPAPVLEPAPLLPILLPLPPLFPLPEPAPKPPAGVMIICPMSYAVVCPPISYHTPGPEPQPTPIHNPTPDFSDCRCNSAGVLICTEPNPPYYIFCPSPPRADPAPCIYECNNESGPAVY